MMKESFARIVTWAKSHPLLAAVIVGAVVLVAYLVYKKNAASGAGASATADTGATSAPDLSGLGAVSGSGAGGGGGSLSDLGSSSVGSSTGGKKKNPAPIQLSGGSGYQTLDAMLPSFSGSLDSLYSGVDVAGATVSPFQNLGVSGAQRAVESGFNLRDAVNAAAPVSSYSSGPGGKVTNKTIKTSTTKTQTPSQLVGKGAKFTGWYNGVLYSNGYPVNKTIANVQPIVGAPGKVSVVSGGAMGNKATSPTMIAL